MDWPLKVIWGIKTLNTSISVSDVTAWATRQAEQVDKINKSRELQRMSNVLVLSLYQLHIILRSSQRRKKRMEKWSELPSEILHSISLRIDNPFDLIHFRSVCSFWRSSSLLKFRRMASLRCLLPLDYCVTVMIVISWVAVFTLSIFLITTSSILVTNSF